MIRINLLPEEYRKKARTPFKMMLAVSCAVAVNATALAYWAWMTFGITAELTTELSVMQMEMDGLTPQVNYHDALDVEIKFHSSRETTLAEVTLNRVLWTKVLDEIVDIVHTGGEGVRHFIWFDSLTVKQESNGGRSRSRAVSWGSLKANGHSGSPVWSQVANYLSDIGDPRLSEVSLVFHPPGSPEGSLNDADSGLIPPVNWSFPLSLELRSPEERQAAMHPEAQ